MAKAKLAQEVAGVKQYPLADRIVAGIKTGYLATVTSRVKHITSVALTQGYRGLAEQPVKVAVDYIQAIGKAAADNRLGEFQKYRNTTYVNPLNPKTIARVGRAGVEGLRDAIQAIKTGVDPERAANAFDIGKVQFKHPMLRAIQNRIDVIVSASNKPFFNMALQASLLDQAQALSKISGETVDYHLDNISDVMAQRALDEATHSTFNDHGPIDAGVAAFKGTLRRWRDKPSTLKPSQRANAQALAEGLTGDAAAERANTLLALKPGEFNKQVTIPREVAESTLGKTARGSAGVALTLSELVAPFVRIGINLGQAGVEMTPAGAGLGLLKALAAKDAGPLMDGVTKATAGTASLVALGYYLQQKGVLTGQSATSASQRRTAGVQGKQPYAVTIGNTSHQYDWAEPLSFPIALGADLAEQQHAHPGHLLGNLATAEGQNLKLLSEKGILGSFAQVSDAAKGDANAAMRWIQGILSPPPIIGQIAKGTDPVANRDTRGTTALGTLWNQEKAKIPGLRETLPARPDALGNTPPRAEGLAGALLDPSNPTTLTHDPVAAELEKHNVGLPAITGRGTLNKQPFTRTLDEQRAMTTQLGPALHQALADYIAKPQYQEARPELQKAMLTNIIKHVKESVVNTDKEQRLRHPQSTPSP